MPKPAKNFFLLLFLMCASAAAIAAQSPPTAPPAPLPAQLFTAKTIFISNTTGRAATYPGISEYTYDEFHALMKSWGRYQIVTAPADADLIFEIRYATGLGPTNGGNSGQYAEFELTIFDTKTHVVLWAVSETVNPIKHKSGQEITEQALANVVSDAKTLVARASPDATGPATK